LFDGPMVDVPNADTNSFLHPNLDGSDPMTAADKTPSGRAISAREPDSDDDMGDRYDAPSPRDR